MRNIFLLRIPSVFKIDKIIFVDGECIAYQYNGTGPGNCILIDRNCTVAEGKMFERDNKTVAYGEGRRKLFLRCSSVNIA